MLSLPFVRIQTILKSVERQILLFLFFCLTIHLSYEIILQFQIENESTLLQIFLQRKVRVQ